MTVEPAFPPLLPLLPTSISLLAGTLPHSLILPASCSWRGPHYYYYHYYYYYYY